MRTAFFFDVTYFDGSPDVYQIPLSVSTGAALDEIAAHQPGKYHRQTDDFSGASDPA